MGPDAPYLNLEFTCGQKTETIQFYSGKIKTPATSFYDQPKKIEEEIWMEIQAQFAQPEFAKPVPKVKNAILDFGKFSIQYLGSEDRTPKGTSASLNVESFRVTANDKSVQTVEVRSGQLSPRPMDFIVGKDTFTLMTFQSEAGQDLYPRQIMILQK
jgi:hypothetical protein